MSFSGERRGGGLLWRVYLWFICGELWFLQMIILPQKIQNVVIFKHHVIIMMGLYIIKQKIQLFSSVCVNITKMAPFICMKNQNIIYATHKHIYCIVFLRKKFLQSFIYIFFKIYRFLFFATNFPPMPLLLSTTKTSFPNQLPDKFQRPGGMYVIKRSEKHCWPWYIQKKKSQWRSLLPTKKKYVSQKKLYLFFTLWCYSRCFCWLLL